MMKIKHVLCLIVAFCLALLCACNGKKEDFYIKSKAAYEGGEILQVIDISAESQTFQIVNGKPIVLKMGIGGEEKVLSPASDGIRSSMWIEISSEGCVINGVKDKYEKEYPDYCSDEKYRPRIQKSKILWYDIRYPKYYESLEIFFPEGECVGVIEFLLWDKINSTLSDTAELKLYFAKTNNVLVISQRNINVSDIHE